MEFLEGESLDVRIEREGKLPAADVLRIGREVALALAAAHKRGMIHRDIKPANIWLEDREGAGGQESTAAGEGDGKRVSSPTPDPWPLSPTRIKILDFGLARATGQEGQLTQQGAIVGTPAYIAPQQAQGKSLDGRCVLFSLGCVLYNLATGKPAFRGSDVVSTLMAVSTEDPPSPRELDASLLQELSDLILGLPAKRPDERRIRESRGGVAPGHRQTPGNVDRPQPSPTES